MSVYTLNSVHSNRITPSTTTTVLLAAFLRNLLPLLVLLRLSSGRCANLRASRSSTRRLSSDRSQVQHPKKTLPPSLCLSAQFMFRCCVAGRLVQTDLQQVDDTHACFWLEAASSMKHICVFLLGTGTWYLTFFYSS